MSAPTPDQVFKWTPGDTVVEAGRLLPAITEEKVVYHVASVNLEKRTIRLNAYFFGVAIGDLVGKEENGAMSWKAQWK